MDSLHKNKYKRPTTVKIQFPVACDVMISLIVQIEISVTKKRKIGVTGFVCDCNRLQTTPTDNIDILAGELPL